MDIQLFPYLISLGITPAEWDKYSYAAPISLKRSMLVLLTPRDPKQELDQTLLDELKKYVIEKRKWEVGGNLPRDFGRKQTTYEVPAISVSEGRDVSVEEVTDVPDAIEFMAFWGHI